MDLVLDVGDVLYLPRGWIHDARTINAESLHLTLGVQVRTRNPSKKIVLIVGGFCTCEFQTPAQNGKLLCVAMTPT